VRYAGAYATRRRVWWRRRGIEPARSRGAAGGGGARGELARAELLRWIFRVDVEVCRRCRGAARIIGFVRELAYARSR
jgi:hypothetical protein